jgi:hypothetical protein
VGRSLDRAARCLTTSSRIQLICAASEDR